MASNRPVVPWRCGRCGEEISFSLAPAICTECRLTICGACVVRVGPRHAAGSYCRSCAGRLGLISAEEAARRPSLWRRLFWRWIIFPGPP